MARIHIARSVGAEGFSRLVAAKRLDPQLVNDDEFVAMFLDEARVASKVRHRNVVPVLDVVTIDGEVIMVQELVHGAPLHKLFARAQQANVLGQPRIPVNIAVSIAAQTLCGLHAAHEAVDETGTALNIVHRDVSPQNIMIATDGTARLLDFGVAKTAAAVHVSQAGTFKGKLAYSSPEQLRGNATRQTDIYALAIVLWELLTGERLHAGRSEPEVFAAIVEGTPPPLTQALAKRRAAGKLDDHTWRQLAALDPVLQKAFARDLAVRYATAAELEHALLAAVAPATLAAVAAWLSSLAQDMLDQTDQLIAAEEASWRKAMGSGFTQPMKLTSHEWCRPTTSLETEAAIPSARARSFGRSKHAAVKPPQRRRRLLLLEFLIADSVAVVLMVLLLVARSSSPHQATAATLPPDLLQRIARATTRAPQRVTHAPHEAPQIKTASTGRPRLKNVTAKRRPVLRPAIKKAAASPKPDDCSIPFYYVGSKKVFKPTCI
jgi:eukaryotic-like serine/threonine-protein kinase